jgi:hypothetical protein
VPQATLPTPATVPAARPSTVPLPAERSQPIYVAEWAPGVLFGVGLAIALAIDCCA